MQIAISYIHANLFKIEKRISIGSLQIQTTLRNAESQWCSTSSVSTDSACILQLEAILTHSHGVEP